MAKRRKSKKSTSKKIQIESNSSGNDMCNSCCPTKGSAWLFLILGLLFLFKDLGFFPWWTVSWWTLLFLVVGYMGLKKHS